MEKEKIPETLINIKIWENFSPKTYFRRETSKFPSCNFPEIVLYFSHDRERG